MEKKYRRKVFWLFMLSPLLATVLAKFLFVFMSLIIWESTTAMHIYIISFDISIKIWALFLLWEGMKKSKSETQEEETQVPESNDSDCSNTGLK
ncbi:hypothetical protein [Anaerotignum sp. MB30-C6]|uniref:hypothetical protein n=1 Tax=Anaerotignum sp. MB30-C6 TaxID=3070814 RepID=UPI0027DB7026|nr:hypothetical protein [Anaerotignum sp. MB30-C6]WMI81087.1 hypothetical protein RBQ60_14955 [Anaerotignum sp. MB30-C6]